MRSICWPLGLLLFVSLVLAGCQEGDNGAPTRVGEVVPVVREFKGQQGPFPDRGFQVIQRQEAWLALWAPSAAPVVDFTQQTVLVALMGRQPTAGYNITIDDVRATGQRIVAYVDEVRPAAGTQVAQVVSYPYHMVVVPKLTQPVSFIVEGQAINPIAVQEQFTGTQARATNAQTAVLRDAGAWRQFWVNNISSTATVPEVDFTQYMAVAVLVGQRPTAGYTVRITGIEQTTDDRLQVAYRVRSPQPGEQVAQVLTSPYAIALVPTSTMPVAFRQITTAP